MEEIDDNEEIDLDEILYLTLHVGEYYERLKEEVKKKSPEYNEDSVYILTAMTILREYRKQDTFKLTTAKMLLYQELVRAIVNNDEKFIHNFMQMLDESKEEI